MDYWFDTHCHLEMIPLDTAQVVKDSQHWGVEKCVTIATEHAKNLQVAQNCQSFAGVFGTWGLHPNHVTHAELEKLAALPEVLAQNPKLVAIGECGFDFFYKHTEPNQQRVAFIKQMEWALALGYPVVVHSREAEQATIETMQPFVEKGLKAVLHSFTSNQELWEFGVRYDLYFSFNGISTYKKSEGIRALLAKTPRNRILLETDAPFLSPGIYRGKTNIPGYVAVTGQILADFLKIPLPTFRNLTTENAHAFYNLVPIV